MRALAVIVNLFAPGIGTILAGKVFSGVVQFILYAVAWSLIATGLGALIGFPLAVVVWIWAIISAATAEDKPLIMVVREPSDTRPPRR